MGYLLSDPTFWVAVAFVIFMAIIVWKAVGPMMRALDKRAERIRDELDEAQRLREDAQHLLAEYKRKLRDAEKEAEEMYAHAQEEAERLKRAGEAQLEAALTRREQQAKDRIAQAEQQAVAQVRALAADVAVAATRDLLVESVDKKTADALIDEAVKQIPDRMH